MKKFNVSSPSNAFKLYSKSSGNELFRFGDGSDFRIDKKGKTVSYCSNNGHYNYSGISDALRGTSNTFTPKRIIVIQMKQIN